MSRAGVAGTGRLSAAQMGLRFLPYARGRWQGLLAVCATMLVKIGLDIVSPWPMKVLVDQVLDQHSTPDWLARLGAISPALLTREALLVTMISATVVLFLLGWVLGVGSSFANIGFGQRMVYDLAIDLFDHLQRLSLRYHSRKSVGDSILRIMSDCNCVSIIYKDALLPAVTSAFSLGSMFLIMWAMDPVLTLLSLSVTPFMIVAVRHYTSPMAERSYEQQEIEGEVYDIIEQNLSAIAVVQAFGREEEGERRFRSATRRTLSATLALTAIQYKFDILLGLATAAGTAGILWVGGRHVLEGSLTVGSILVFLSYLGSLYGPLHSLLYTPSTIQGAAGSARRVLEVLEADREVTDRPGAVAVTAARGHVRLEGVSFGYEAGRPILRDVWLEARPGETVAIVGATGAGKSTLVGLIPRFFDPWEGRVTLDGRDVRELQLRSLRQQVALVLQEPFLFPLSIAENIAYGRPEATREQVIAAARAANADEFIERLPEGYDTVVGERGATLSGGQRQRLSIARALLKDAPILILDEPTSALDAQTEALLLGALDRLMVGRTTFIIAHRLSTIRRADRIAVLDNGTVAEQGSHAELLARGGLYAHLHGLQHGAGLSAATAGA